MPNITFTKDNFYDSNNISVAGTVESLGIGKVYNFNYTIPYYNSGYYQKWEYVGLSCMHRPIVKLVFWSEHASEWFSPRFSIISGIYGYVSDINNTPQDSAGWDALDCITKYMLWVYIDPNIYDTCLDDLTRDDWNVQFKFCYDYSFDDNANNLVRIIPY